MLFSVTQTVVICRGCPRALIWGHLQTRELLGAHDVRAQKLLGSISGAPPTDGPRDTHLLGRPSQGVGMRAGKGQDPCVCRPVWCLMSLGVYPPTPPATVLMPSSRDLSHGQAEAVPAATVIPGRGSCLVQEPRGVGGAECVCLSERKARITGCSGQSSEILWGPGSGAREGVQPTRGPEARPGGG